MSKTASAANAAKAAPAKDVAATATEAPGKELASSANGKASRNGKAKANVQRRDERPRPAAKRRGA